MGEGGVVEPWAVPASAVAVFAISVPRVEPPV
jgi:hypothetical protein